MTRLFAPHQLEIRRGAAKLQRLGDGPGLIGVRRKPKIVPYGIANRARARRGFMPPTLSFIPAIPIDRSCSASVP
jgi:hypothetical protein